MKMKKNAVTAARLLGAGAVLFALAGCGQNTPSTPGASNDSTATSGAKKKQIAAILMQNDQFFRLNEIGMQEAAKRHGVNLLTDSANGALDKEINLVDTYAARGVDAIVVSPINPKSSAPALKRAAAKGIKIITYNGMLDAKVAVGDITSDQIALGATTAKAAAAYIKQKLGGKAKMALIEFISLSSEQGPMRPKGFKDEIKKLPGAQIVAEQDAWLAPQAEKVVTDILNAHPEVNVIWAANEGGTVGAVTAVKNAGKAGKVVVFGTDMSDQIAGFLLSPDNILQAVTGQKPLEMGNAAIDAAVNALDGKPVENVVLPGVLFQRGDEAPIKDFQKKVAQATR
jgi:ABC-type sugar transport system substrate-binding protein